MTPNLERSPIASDAPPDSPGLGVLRPPLADRIAILTPHPGTVRTELKVARTRMRDPVRVAFLGHRREVIAHPTGQGLAGA